MNTKFIYFLSLITCVVSAQRSFKVFTDLETQNNFRADTAFVNYIDAPNVDLEHSRSNHMVYKVATIDNNTYANTNAILVAYTGGISGNAAIAFTGSTVQGIYELTDTGGITRLSTLFSGLTIIDNSDDATKKWNGTQWQVISSAAAPTPVGTISMWPFDTAPAGWLICNGSAIPSGTEYDALRDLFAGNPQTGGNLPNFTNYFPRGKSSSRNLLSHEGYATARPTITSFTTNTTGNHHHHSGYSSNRDVTPQYGWGRTNVGPAEVGTGAGEGNEGLANTSTTGNHSHTITGGGDSETRPVNIAINFIIKY